MDKNLKQHTAVSQSHNSLHKKFQDEFDSLQNIIQGIEQKLALSAEKQSQMRLKLQDISDGTTPLVNFQNLRKDFLEYRAIDQVQKCSEIFMPKLRILSQDIESFRF